MYLWHWAWDIVRGDIIQKSSQLCELYYYQGQLFATLPCSGTAEFISLLCSTVPLTSLFLTSSFSIPSVSGSHGSFCSAHTFLFIWILGHRRVNSVSLIYFTFLSQLLWASRNNVFLFQYFSSALLLALSSLLISVTVIYFFSISTELSLKIFHIFFLLKLPTCSGTVHFLCLMTRDSQFF